MSKPLVALHPQLKTKRQNILAGTDQSPVSHCDMTDDELLTFVSEKKEHWHLGSNLRSNVMFCPLPPSQCLSPIIRLSETLAIAAGWTARTDMDPGSIIFYAPEAERARCVSAEVVLFRHDLPTFQDEDCQWQVVRIQTRTQTEGDPLHPLVLLDKPGLQLPALVSSCMFWHTRVLAGVPENLLVSESLAALTAGVSRPARGPSYVLAFTKEMEKLPLKRETEPGKIIDMTMQMFGYQPGMISDRLEDWVDSANYWFRRALPDPSLPK